MDGRLVGRKGVVEEGSEGAAKTKAAAGLGRLFNARDWRGRCGETIAVRDELNLPNRIEGLVDFEIKKL